MGAAWIITDKEKSFEIKHQIHYKDQNQNIPRASEACSTLNLILLLKQKGSHITKGGIIIIHDNKKIHKIIHREMSIPSKFVQDATAAVMQIIHKT